MSNTKLVSLGSTSFVLKAWQVNMELRSLLCIAGHRSRFSITSPELCSYWSSTARPFINHRTAGWGRPSVWMREKKLCIKNEQARNIEIAVINSTWRLSKMLIFLTPLSLCTSTLCNNNIIGVDVVRMKRECREREKSTIKRGGKGMEGKKLLMKKDLIAFLCKFNSVLIASTTNGWEERERGKKYAKSLRRGEKKTFNS